jgi:hypothetical protein
MRSTPAGDEHVRDELRGDGLARGRLLVLPRVRVPGHDRRDPVRRGKLGGLDHDHELHQVVVRVQPVARLDEEDVRARIDSQ